MPILVVCQGCGQRGSDVRRIDRIRTKDYMGPCGDSFCYASCDSPSCRDISAILCEECARKLPMMRLSEFLEEHERSMLKSLDKDAGKKKKYLDEVKK